MTMSARFCSTYNGLKQAIVTESWISFSRKHDIVKDDITCQYSSDM